MIKDQQSNLMILIVAWIFFQLSIQYLIVINCLFAKLTQIKFKLETSMVNIVEITKLFNANKIIINNNYD